MRTLRVLAVPLVLPKQRDEALGHLKKFTKSHNLLTYPLPLLSFSRHKFFDGAERQASLSYVFQECSVIEYADMKGSGQA